MKVNNNDSHEGGGTAWTATRELEYIWEKAKGLCAHLRDAIRLGGVRVQRREVVIHQELVDELHLVLVHPIQRPCNLRHELRWDVTSRVLF